MEVWRENGWDMGVTLEDIARRLGISKATASRALNSDRLIHPDTRSRVLEEAARCGYERPAKRGKGVAKRQPRVLFLLPAHSQTSASDFQLYLRGLTRGAGEANCLLSVEEIPEAKKGSSRANLPREIRNETADVVIVAYKHDPANIAAIARMRPVVSIQWDHEAPTDLVSAFNYRGVVSLVRRMAELGHRRLAWVKAGYEASFFADREMGFLRGARDAGLEVGAEDCLASLDQGGLKKLRDRGVTGILCANDWVALQVAELAVLQGLRIPEDLSITGFDAGPEKVANGKVLSSYDPGFAELGRLAVFAAMQRLKDPGAPRLIYLREGRMQEGETVGRVAKLQVVS